MQNSIYPFTGGNLQTNCYIVKLPRGTALIDAPGDVALWAVSQDFQVDALILTHSHFDHVEGAAEVVRQWQCPVIGHPLCNQMAEETGVFKQYGLDVTVEPVGITREVEETDSVTILGADFAVYHIPGHHPGSLVFHWKNGNAAFVGDVLMAGSVGRTDLPGGSHQQLITGIREKLLPLPESTLVLPGHGPSTSIGEEKRGNPFLS